MYLWQNNPSHVRPQWFNYQETNWIDWYLVDCLSFIIGLDYWLVKNTGNPTKQSLSLTWMLMGFPTCRHILFISSRKASQNIVAKGILPIMRWKRNDACQSDNIGKNVGPAWVQTQKPWRDDFKNILAKIRKISMNKSIIIQKSWKHYDQRRNCQSWAISTFATMFQKNAADDFEHILSKSLLEWITSV